MLNVRTLPLGSYQTNCYIVYDSDATTCAIIDPGYSAKTVLETAALLERTIDAVLLTHGHFDHVGAVKQIVEETGCALWMHEGDWSQTPAPMISYFYPLANCDFTEVQFCEHMEKISAGGLNFQVYETPGHTHGSVCYQCEDTLFTGDTLFAGSCGRTDLPGGDQQVLEESLEWLSKIEKNYTVYPGHGESTTLAVEKQYNPYLR